MPDVSVFASRGSSPHRVPLALPCAAQERIAVVATTTRPQEPRRGRRRRPRRGGEPRPATIDVEELPAEAAGHAAPQIGAPVRAGRARLRPVGRSPARASRARPRSRRGGPFYVDASRGIAVLELRGMSVGPGDGHAHGSGNPHYWLDPKNAEIITAHDPRGIGRGSIRSMPRDYETRPRGIRSRACTQSSANGRPALAPLRDDADRRLPQQLAVFCAPLPARPPRLHRDRSRACRRAPRISPRSIQAMRSPRRPHSSSASRTSRNATSPSSPARPARSIVTLAASVGALPAAGDYIALFDADVEALKAAAETK